MAEDLERELGSQPLDLYIMTHEHMDHVDVEALTALARDGLAEHEANRGFAVRAFGPDGRCSRDGLIAALRAPS